MRFRKIPLCSIDETGEEIELFMIVDDAAAQTTDHIEPDDPRVVCDTYSEGNADMIVSALNRTLLN